MKIITLNGNNDGALIKSGSAFALDKDAIDVACA